MRSNNSGTEHTRDPLVLRAILRSTTSLTGLTLAVTLMAGAARADDWTGATSSNWLTDTNWADGTAPIAADDIRINTVTPNPTVVNAPGAEANNVSVGYVAGTGALTIEGGGTLTNINATLASNSTAQGTVLVTGTGSQWSGNTLSVGQRGIGTVTVGNGGKVDYVTNYIGTTFSAHGTVTVTGDGSLLVNDWGGTKVAVSGTGVLNIKNRGAVITNGSAQIGIFMDGVGTANVTGNGSRWTIAGDLEVGYQGTGTLTIDQGAVVSNSTTMVGEDPGSTGTLNLSGMSGARGVLETHTISTTAGAASIVFDGGKLRALSNQPGLIGAGFAPGDITIAAGGAYIDTNGWDVGFQSPLGGSGELVKQGDGNLILFTPNTHGSTRVSEGTLAVYGTAASITHAAGGMIVGDQAGILAGLLIAGGGTVENGNGYIGQTSGSEGAATVTGTGSTWTNSGYLFIGEHGTGTLTIEDGGNVITGGNASVGRDSGGGGTATVTGPGSTWTTNGFLNIGDQPDSEGSLTISNQGTVISSSQVRLANAPGTQGTALVTGMGSKWIGTPTQFHVGFWDQGTLIVADGGEVQSGFTTLGTWGSSSGTATVTGGGSVWNISDDFEVGVWGTGVLTIGDGSTVNSIDSTIGVEADGVGSVTVMDGSSWTNMASLEVGGNGSGTLRIDSGGSVTNSNGYIGRGAGSTGAAVVAGISSTWTNTGDLYVGDGGDGTLIIGPSAAVTATGAVSVADQPGSSGLVVVNGDLEGIGGINVNAGGRLAGFGTVTGTTTVGGTVAPGNSIGTLNVVGNYTQAAGSTYEVEIDAAGNSDLIDVTGAATLNGGTVEIIPLPDFALATPYTILTATGGVTGTFAGTSMGFSSGFLSPQLTYGTNDVTFAIAQTASFASAALTPNQEAAAEGADSLGAGNAVWNAIALLPSAAAPAAFDAISGEVHASTGSVLIEDSRFMREAIDARLREAFAGVGAKTMPVLAYGDEGPDVAPTNTDRFVAWGHTFGSWGEWGSDGNAASLTRDTGGFVLGGDMAVADIWRLGLLAGYSSSSFHVDDRASSGSVESYHLGAYAGTEIGKWGLRFGGAYSWHDVDTARTASFAGFTDSLEAEYDAATAQFFAEAGYRIGTAHASFEPFANLAYINLQTDGFTETGGAAALTASSSSQDTAFTTLGLRAETALPLGGMTARLHGMLGWRHAFGDVTPTSGLAFAGGSAFTIAGVPIAEDAAIIEAGLDLALSPNAKLGIAYNGQIGSGVSDHGLNAGLTVKF